MAMSTGTRHFILESLVWIAAAGVIAFTVVNYDFLTRSLARAAGADPAAAAKKQQMLADLQAAQKPATASTVELKVGRDGHFHTEVEVNGRPVPVLVDTGATNVALTYEDAERAGIFLKKSDFKYGAQTANGVARVAMATIDTISLGDITVRDVRATVHQSGGLATTLLGMAFLSRLSRVEMRPGMLVLHD